MNQVTLRINQHIVWGAIPHLEDVVEETVSCETFNEGLLTLLKIVRKGKIEEIP